VLAAVTIATAGLAAACGGGEPGPLDLAGERVEVVAVWQDAEADAFEAVLDRFEAETGATVTFTSSGDEDLTVVLDRRFDAGSPPGVAVLPQPGLLARYARQGRLLRIEELVGEAVDESWAPVWRRLGSVDGELYGLWFKAADKSLVWYSITAFERAGVVPPEDLDGLAAVARTLTDTGIPAFARTGAPSDAWTLTDWFENLYLRVAGPDRYDALAEHRLPWTDPTVARTLRLLADLLGEGRSVQPAGPATTLEQAVRSVFAAEPGAAMLMEGDFVPGVVAGRTAAELGVHVDVFAFPERRAGERSVVGGGDAAVLLRDTPGGRALLEYLATPEAAQTWAALGGFVSPNEDVDLAAYPDPITRRIARSVLEAGDALRFDLSDQTPVDFGGTTDSVLWRELSAFVADPSDVAGTTARLEAYFD